MIKRFLVTAAGLLAAVFLFSCPAGAISAEKGILVDASTDRVLYEKDPDSRSLIASTTKIMTGLLISEQCNVLDRMRIPKEAVGIEGSSMYLQEGEILTVQELLYGLMLRSGNDAAVALAIYCGGTVSGFVELMNDKAHRLGLTGTHFENPHGLDSPGHYSTARDLAVLAAHAMDNPIFRQTVSTKSVRIGQRTLINHNKLLWQYPGADGVKTGFTRAAGRILVSSACRDGRRLVCVTINDGDDWLDHTALLDRGYSQYSLKTVFRRGEAVGTVEIVGGESSRVQLLAEEDFVFPLTAEETAHWILSGPGFSYAPVVQGQLAGYAYICIDDHCVGKVPVVYGHTVEQSREDRKQSFWSKLFGGVP